MIDTVCLLIPKTNLTMLDLLQYGVSSWDLYSKTSQYDKFVKNPSKKDLDSGLYFPRLTGYRRKSFGQDANVRIEFSVSKLLYSNNLDELEDKDFGEVVDTLHDRLKLMGVVVSKNVLEQASVSSVHFSRNIHLEDGYTVNHLISEINKVDLRKSFDFAKTRFMNDGQSLYAHTTSHQFVIYDKIADLCKDKKRAIDKDQTRYHKNLFEVLSKNTFNPEVLRFEIRLNHKQKMNKVLEGLGYIKNPNFKSIFNSKLSQQVVESYWKKLIKERNLGLFSVSINSKDILRLLFMADKELKPKQAIYLFGLFQLTRDENGMRQLRGIISKYSHDRTWYRIVKDVCVASQLITKNKIRNWVTQIDNKLSNYQPYKIKQ